MGGNGGDALDNGSGGIGGNGGNLVINSREIVTDFGIPASIGPGGTGGNADGADSTGGAGGNGGSVFIATDTLTATQQGASISLYAGFGANGGVARNGGVGGNGGSGSYLHITANTVTTQGSVNFYAGTAGDGGNADADTGSQGGNGGNGGNLNIQIAGTFTAGSLMLQSGNNGSNGTAGGGTAGNGGTGGSLTLTAGTLSLTNSSSPSKFIRQDGEFTVNIGTLDVTDHDVSLDLDNTEAWNGHTGVNLGILAIGGGKTLSIDDTNGMNPGSFAFRGLAVTGINARYTGTSALDATGKSLAFLLPSDIRNTDTMLETANPITIQNAQVRLSAAGPLSELNPGDSITLIDKTSGTIAANNQSRYIATRGATFNNFIISSDNNRLIATLAGKDTSTSLSYAEGQMAGLAAIQRANDLVARFSDSPDAQCRRSRHCIQPFFTTSATHEKIRTGSHINANGFAVMGGIAARGETASGSLLGTLFMEGGWGNYSSYNNFAFTSVRGHGNTHYLGGGILARHDFTASGLYTEGAFHLGQARTDFDTRDMGEDARFDTDVRYYSGHAALGIILPITNTTDTLDLSIKVLWTRLDDSAVSTGAGEKLRFDSLDSLRSRLGVRYARNLNDTFRGYTGIAWDHEYKSRLDSTLNGAATRSPDMQGNTGIIEAGITWQAEKAWHFDVNAQGMLGQHKGVAGAFYARHTF